MAEPISHPTLMDEEDPPGVSPVFGILFKITADPMVLRAALADVEPIFKLHANPYVLKADGTIEE